MIPPFKAFYPTQQWNKLLSVSPDSQTIRCLKHCRKLNSITTMIDKICTLSCKAVLIFVDSFISNDVKCCVNIVPLILILPQFNLEKFQHRFILHVLQVSSSSTRNLNHRRKVFYFNITKTSPCNCLPLGNLRKDLLYRGSNTSGHFI